MRGARKWELMQNSSSWQFAHDEISNDRLHTGNFRVINIASNYVSSMNYERLRDTGRNMVLVNQGFEQRNTTTYDYEAMKNNAKKLRFGNFCNQ